MNQNIRTEVFVSGRVQGVFFRQNIQRKARSLGLNGWVRNLPDGKVEALFEGEKEIIKEMIKWIEKGPFLSRVDDLKINWLKAQGDLEGFQIVN